MTDDKIVVDHAKLVSLFLLVASDDDSKDGYTYRQAKEVISSRESLGRYTYWFALGGFILGTGFGLLFMSLVNS